MSGQFVTGSSFAGRFSDEAFGQSDIQFNRPQIRVDSCSFGEEIGNFRRVRRFGWAGSLPAIGPGQVEDPLKAGEVPTARADQQQKRSALPVAPPDDGREIAVGTGPP